VCANLSGKLSVLFTSVAAAVVVVAAAAAVVAVVVAVVVVAVVVVVVERVWLALPCSNSTAPTHTHSLTHTQTMNE